MHKVGSDQRGRAYAGRTVALRAARLPTARTTTAATARNARCSRPGFAPVRVGGTARGNMVSLVVDGGALSTTSSPHCQEFILCDWRSQPWTEPAFYEPGSNA